MRPGDLDTDERPFVLVWELTRACEHCRADARPERHPDELTTAEGERLLDDVREFGENQLVVLSGGDPMARPDTVELVGYGVDRGLRMTLTPSGTDSLTGDVVGDLADAGLRRMALSIDGGSAGGSDGRRTGIYAGDGFAFVSHVGEVYPSGFLPESAGDVREERVVDVYRDADLFERLRDRDALRGKCGACPFRYACGGSRSRAYAHTGDPMASDPLCPYVPDGYDGPLPGTLEPAP